MKLTLVFSIKLKKIKDNSPTIHWVGKNYNSSQGKTPLRTCDNTMISYYADDDRDDDRCSTSFHNIKYSS